MLVLDHVQLAMPPGGEVDARRFFGEILGLPEISKPDALASRGGCWFRLGRHELHLGVEVPFRPAKKAHVALATYRLDELRDSLEKEGYPIRSDVPIEGRRRFFTDDPFGNRLELLQIDPG